MSGSGRLGTISLLRTVTYGRSSENVGVLLLVITRTGQPGMLPPPTCREEPRSIGTRRGKQGYGATFRSQVLPL